MPKYHDSVSHTRVIETDAATRSKKLFHWDAATQSFTIETVTDVEDVLEQNKLEKNNINTKQMKGDMHKVASLPLMVWMKLRQTGCLQDPKCLRKVLLDPENRHFLTRDHF